MNREEIPHELSELVDLAPVESAQRETDEDQHRYQSALDEVQAAIAP